MNLLAGLSQDNDIKAEEDTLGGSYGPLDSGVYTGTIKFAYLTKAASGALALNLGFEFEDGSTYKETVYVMSGNAKGNKNFYVTKNGDKKYLPGFLVGDAIALFTTQKNLAQLETETKIVKIYSSDQQKEVPTEVPMITEMLGNKVSLGIKHVIEDKRAKDASGNYVATGETRSKNETDKVFHPTNGMTVPEIRAKATEAAFIETWKTKWEGKVQDNSDKSKKAESGTPATTTSASSLFNV